MKDGMMRLRHARLDEKPKVYRSLYCSETTALHTGPPNYSNNFVPTWEEFQEDFEDYYFLSEGRSTGSVMIIEQAEEEIGCVCYATFHLYSKRAELDIWMNRLNNCGKGYGIKALNLLCRYLKEQFDVGMFLIRPSEKNTFAIKAYKKVGFKEISSTLKMTTIQDWVRPQYMEEYGYGDYGVDETAILIKQFNSMEVTNGI
jgi:diamine N-acetyltransferase